MELESEGYATCQKWKHLVLSVRSEELFGDWMLLEGNRLGRVSEMMLRAVVIQIVLADDRR